jgi:hypothetical protein
LQNKTDIYKYGFAKTAISKNGASLFWHDPNRTNISTW